MLKPKQQFEVVGVRLKLETAEKMKLIAADERRTLSGLIRILCEDFVEKTEKKRN